MGSDPTGDAAAFAALADRALPKDGDGVRDGGLYWVAVRDEELAAASIDPHLADSAETANQRGPKKRAKTDRPDARLQRTQLMHGRLPESWISLTHVLEVRILGRLGQLYCALMDERRVWQQRIHAHLFHQGCPPIKGGRAGDADRRRADSRGAAIGRHCAAGDCLADHRDRSVAGAAAGDFRTSTARLPSVASPPLWGGVGWLCAAIIWAAFEAARCAARRGSPDHVYYHKVAAKAGGKNSALAVERKLLRRCYHTPRELR